MDSILNISVSCFANYEVATSPKPVNMMQWLKSAKYADRVQQIREISDKAERDNLKATLPGITPSGTFTYRAADKLVQHSGFMQFDIDMKGNEHISNYDDLKSQICNINNVAYCGLSVSGRGYWGLVPIKHPDKHKSHFKALKNAFSNLGLTIDKSCSDVSRLRGYSYDPAGYFNHSATVFELLDKPEPRPVQRNHFDNDTRGEVEELIQKIQAGRVDITAGYDNWLKVAFALSEEFGEAGREYFHAVSQWHPEYNQRQTDQQYTQCLKARGSGVSISSFFYLCKHYDITLNSNDNYHTVQKDRRSVAIQDAEPDELQQLMQQDPVLNEIVNTFDAIIEN